jgi:hypothetical protein
MRWLADENIPGYAIAYPRQRDEDVLSIAETSPASCQQCAGHLLVLPESGGARIE